MCPNLMENCASEIIPLPRKNPPMQIFLLESWNPFGNPFKQKLNPTFEKKSAVAKNIEYCVFTFFFCPLRVILLFCQKKNPIKY